MLMPAINRARARLRLRETLVIETPPHDPETLETMAAIARRIARQTNVTIVIAPGGAVVARAREDHAPIPTRRVETAMHEWDAAMQRYQRDRVHAGLAQELRHQLPALAGA